MTTTTTSAHASRKNTSGAPQAVICDVLGKDIAGIVSIRCAEMFHCAPPEYMILSEAGRSTRDYRVSGMLAELRKSALQYRPAPHLRAEEGRVYESIANATRGIVTRLSKLQQRDGHLDACAGCRAMLFALAAVTWVLPGSSLKQPPSSSHKQRSDSAKASSSSKSSSSSSKAPGVADWTVTPFLAAGGSIYRLPMPPGTPQLVDRYSTSTVVASSSSWYVCELSQEPGATSHAIFMLTRTPRLSLALVRCGLLAAPNALCGPARAEIRAMYGPLPTEEDCLAVCNALATIFLSFAAEATVSSRGTRAFSALLEHTLRSLSPNTPLPTIWTDDPNTPETTVAVVPCIV